MVNLMAVTTVVLIRAEGEDREAFSLGRRASGDIKQRATACGGRAGPRCWGRSWRVP